MSANLSELCYSSSSSSLDPSDIIEKYADSDINELSQPPIYDLDAEVSRLLDHNSSGSESDDESSSPSSPLNKRQESQAKSHDEPSSIGGRPSNTQVNEQLCHHSKSTNSPFQRADTKHEAQYYETRSVRGSGGITTAPPVKEMTKDPAVTLHSEDGGGMLLASNIPQLVLGENLLAGTHLSLHQLQSEGSKPTAVGSLLETTSASSSQLDDDSDEYSAKPLFEELEEAANKNMVEEKPPSPNQGVLVNTDSDDYSDSIPCDSEEESEDFKSGEETMSGEEINFELEDGDPSPQNLSDEEELPSPLLIALTTTATQQSSHGSAGNVGKTKDMLQRITTSAGVVQSSSDRASKHSTVTKNQVEMESSQMQGNLELIPAAVRGGPQVPVHIKNIQDERMMPNETGHGSIVNPPHSSKVSVPEADAHTAVVSQSPKIQQNEDSTTTGKKIKRFLPSKKSSVSGGIGRDASHSGALVLSNAPTTQFDLKSRCEITPQARTEEENAPSSEKQFELQLKDVTSYVSSISTACEILSPTTVSLEASPHGPTVRDFKPPSSQFLPGVPPLTSAMGLCRPLKGILKKKSSYERNSTSTGATIDSDEDKDHKHLSKGSAPLSSKIAPSEEICYSSKICDESSSTRVSSEDLERTFTEESKIKSFSATPNFGSLSKDVGSATRPSNAPPYKLDQTDEDTLITGDGDIPNEGNGIKSQDNLNSSITMQSSDNDQHTAAVNSLQPTLDSKLVEHAHIDCEITPLKNDEELDGLPTSLRVNTDLVDKVKALEKRQLKMVNVFAVERAALWNIITKQNQVMSSLCRKGQQDQAKLTNMKRHLKLLERKLEDLEAEVVQVGRTAVGQQRKTTPGSESEAYTPPDLEPSYGMGSLVSTKKLAKLTKFFGDTPPILQQFLERLGYEEHIATFKSAGIGLPELPHITADRLKELGIPLGHRIRILKEAQKLS